MEGAAKSFKRKEIYTGLEGVIRAIYANSLGWIQPM